MKIIWILCLLVTLSYWSDLLNGNGLFNSASNINNWRWVNKTAYTTSIITNGTNGYLTLTKIEKSVFSYDDGMYYYFGDSNPKHIHFEILTREGTKETGDFRLVYLDNSKVSSNVFSKVDNSDSVFFRFGFYNFIRVNLEDLIYGFEPARWYTIDLLLNWSDQKVAIFVDGNYITTVIFFYNNNIDKWNALMIYNLTPDSTIKVANLQVWTSNWAGYEKLVYSSASSIFYNAMIATFLIMMLMLLISI